MKRLLISLIIILTGQCYSQDIRGAFIQTKYLSPNNYSITLILYSDATFSISRPTISINFGDGNVGSFTLGSTSSWNGGNRKTYSGTHTYSGSGSYNVSYIDDFRVAGIKNMLNSQTQQIFVARQLVINNWSTSNSSPNINFDPVGLGESGNQIYYNAGCNDVDGDSISYSMINCSGTNYYLPNNVTLNNLTGLFTFSNDTIGLYAFSFIIYEWRKNLSNIYIIIGSSQLDFIAERTIAIGLNENVKNNRIFFLYPNPVSNELSISVDKNSADNYSIEIVNSLGQIVLKTKYADKINVSELPKGFYVLKLSDKNISSDNIKFIKD